MPDDETLRGGLWFRLREALRGEGFLCPSTERVLAALEAAAGQAPNAKSELLEAARPFAKAIREYDAAPAERWEGSDSDNSTLPDNFRFESTGATPPSLSLGQWRRLARAVAPDGDSVTDDTAAVQATSGDPVAAYSDPVGAAAGVDTELCRAGAARRTRPRRRDVDASGHAPGSRRTLIAEGMPFPALYADPAPPGVTAGEPTVPAYSGAEEERVVRDCRRDEDCLAPDGHQGKCVFADAEAAREPNQGQEGKEWPDHALYLYLVKDSNGTDLWIPATSLSDAADRWRVALGWPPSSDEEPESVQRVADPDQLILPAADALLSQLREWPRGEEALALTRVAAIAVHCLRGSRDYDPLVVANRLACALAALDAAPPGETSAFHHMLDERESAAILNQLLAARRAAPPAPAEEESEGEWGGTGAAARASLARRLKSP